MWKKLLAVLLAAVMVFSLVACGPSETGEKEPEKPADEGEEVVDEGEEVANEDTDFTIATVVKLTGVAWFDRMEVGVNKFAEDTGVDAFQTGANTADPAAQVAVIEDMIAQNVDAICVVPNSTES